MPGEEVDNHAFAPERQRIVGRLGLEAREHSANRVLVGDRPLEFWPYKLELKFSVPNLNDGSVGIEEERGGNRLWPKVDRGP